MGTVDTKFAALMSSAVNVSSPETKSVISANTPDTDKLKAVAQDFEALMVEQMMKSMREADKALSKDGLLNSREQAFWREFQDSQLAEAMVKSQGLGLADEIVEQVQRLQGGGRE